MMDRKCRSCGIEDIHVGMVDARGEQLAWSENDQCSSCADDEAEAEKRDAARYRYLRDRKASDAEIWLGGVFAGIVPQNVILGGEDLDRAVDRAMGADPVTGPTLQSRLADCLAEVIDRPILTGRDEPGWFSSPLDIRLGFFHPDLANRAAELLEEAGR